MVAAVSTCGMAIVDWAGGAGLFTPTFFVAVGGTILGFVTNYRKLRESWPLFVADVGAGFRRIRGKV